MPAFNYDDYYAAIRGAESGGNPNAKNPRSSASGLYQFTKPTWEGLGYDWDDRFNTAVQNQAVQKFTQQNADGLTRAGIPVNSSTLYAAHFLGLGGAKTVLKSDVNTPMTSLVSNGVANANPFLKGMNAGDFSSWLDEKVGSAKEGASNLVNGAKTAAKVGFQLASGDVIGAASTAAGADGDGALAKLIAWLKELFSANTAARFAAVIIGVVLIGGAIWALVTVNKES